MKFYSLASGSSGNCFLVDNGIDLLLIDVGIPFVKIKEKLTELGYNVENINYILITHSHIDHIRSLNSFSNKKIYSSVKIPGLLNKLEKNIEIELGSYKILSFPLSHDVDCCGYRISYEKESLLYATDTGYINSRIMKYLEDATYYIFESNHDIEMLMNSSRPYFLKSRILSDKGHLSNEDASEILFKCIGKNTKEIYLAHISQDCNTKKLAFDTLIKTFNANNFDYQKLKIQALDREEILQGGILHEQDCLGV